MAVEKRSSAEFGERSELGSKRVKMRDLESVLHSERFNSYYPKSSENREDSDPFLSVAEEKSQVTKETVTINSDVARAERTGRDTLPLQVDPAPRTLDFNAKVCVATPSACGDGQCANKLSSFGIEHYANFVTPRGFGGDFNAEDLSSSLNQDPFYPHRSCEHLKVIDASECGSTTGPLEERDPMRVWKEMKHNGFLSSSHGGIPVPKLCGRKSKNDELKKKMELAKREQVDRFARMAAPSGLLNELNPGIINHVRNRVQVHSIMAALVRSKKLENLHVGSKQGIQMKSGTKDISEKKNDLENVKGLGMNRPHLSPEDRSFITLSRSLQTKDCSISKSELLNLNSKGTVGDCDSSMVDSRFIGKSFCPSHSNPDNVDDILALKLSSSTTILSENTSSLSNEESANLTTIYSISVKAAIVAFQWLELLHQDIKGRLAALRCSKKRVRAVIDTQLSFLISTEFSSNQENDLCVMKNSHAGCSDNVTADMHQARWSFLFDQMDKALSEEEKQLESWLIQVKEMQLHCERGLQLFQYNDATYGWQRLGTIENPSKLAKVYDSERELAVGAAAASIYSTCNFLLSMENLPCF